MKAIIIAAIAIAAIGFLVWYGSGFASITTGASKLVKDVSKLADEATTTSEPSTGSINDPTPEPVWYSDGILDNTFTLRAGEVRSIEYTISEDVTFPFKLSGSVTGQADSDQLSRVLYSIKRTDLVGSQLASGVVGRDSNLSIIDETVEKTEILKFGEKANSGQIRLKITFENKADIDQTVSATLAIAWSR